MEGGFEQHEATEAVGTYRHLQDEAMGEAGRTILALNAMWITSMHSRIANKVRKGRYIPHTYAGLGVKKECDNCSKITWVTCPIILVIICPGSNIPLNGATVGLPSAS